MEAGVCGWRYGDWLGDAIQIPAFAGMTRGRGMTGVGRAQCERAGCGLRAMRWIPAEAGMTEHTELAGWGVVRRRT